MKINFPAIVVSTLCAIGLPGHAVAQLLAPTSVVEHTPFMLAITAQNASLCDGATVNVVGNVRLIGTVAEITMPPVGTRCASRRFDVPGLPRGITSLRVQLTALGVDANRTAGGGTMTVATQTLTQNIEVRPLFGLVDMPRFWTAEFRSALSPGPVRFQLTAGRTAMFTGQLLWFEAGDPLTTGYTFKSLSAPLERGELPPTLSRLKQVEYPAPFTGAFVTVDAALAQTLATSWSRVVDELPFAVGKLEAGACPIGMTPVYRLFNPTAFFHRWTQQLETYRVLVANGYIGEGAAWCAPDHD